MLTQEQSDRLTALENRGRVTPDDVIEDARKASSPLHELFNWDVKAAALEHWRERAREIIRLPRVITTVDTHQIVYPRYVRDPGCVEGNVQGYIRTDLAKRRCPHEVLQMECERVLSALHRARLVAAGLGLSGQIDELIAKVSGICEKVSA